MPMKRSGMLLGVMLAAAIMTLALVVSVEASGPLDTVGPGSAGQGAAVVTPTVTPTVAPPVTPTVTPTVTPPITPTVTPVPTTTIKPQPVALAISKAFSVTYTEVMSMHTSGFGFGEIYRAFMIARSSKGQLTAQEVLDLKSSGMGWGQIMKEYDFRQGGNGLGSIMGNGKGAGKDKEPVGKDPAGKGPSGKEPDNKGPADKGNPGNNGKSNCPGNSCNAPGQNKGKGTK